MKVIAVSMGLMGLMLCMSAGAAESTPLFKVDFESGAAGRVTVDARMGEPLACGVGFRVRSIERDGGSVFSAEAFAELVDGVGPDGTRCLRVVDASQQHHVYSEFHSPAKALRRGVIRFDVCFETLPSGALHSFGRRNFMWDYTINPDGGFRCVTPNRASRRPLYLVTLIRFDDDDIRNTGLREFHSVDSRSTSYKYSP